jgi:hypothetical protein
VWYRALPTAELGLQQSSARERMTNFWIKVADVFGQRQRGQSAVSEAKPSLPSTYNTASEIEVVREQDGSFQVSSANGTVLYLSGAEAVQVHRYLSPLKGCTCSCSPEEGVLVNPHQLVKQGRELVFETRTNLPGCQLFEFKPNIVALRDGKNSTLALNRSAGRKLHFSLRPARCQCGCLIDANDGAIQRGLR